MTPTRRIAASAVMVYCDNQPAPERATGAPQRRVRSPAARPFDMWLEKQLQSMYGIEQQSQFISE